MASHYPVSTVAAAYNACNPEEPLAPGDPRYVDLTEVRGGESLARILAWGISNTQPPGFHQRLITGHRGSGKSTELRQLEARLEQAGFFTIYLDVEDILDLGEITYQDILVAIARALDRDLRERKIEINRQLLVELDRWFAERILTEEQRRNVEQTLSAEFGVGVEIPLLTRMLTAITGQIHSGSSRRLEIRRVLEQELSVFIQRLNVLIEEARTRVRQHNYRDLVIIVDGLEKMHFRELPDGQSSHSALFVHHAEQLKAPRCHLVYTVPISLVFNANLGDAFPDPTFVIPMVDCASVEGRERLFDVVARRVDVDAVFADRETVNRLIEMSGGAMRDLMRLVRISCEGVDTQITVRDTERAIRVLAREFDRLLRDEDLEDLLWVAENRRIPADVKYARLLHLRLVHEYQNGERWAQLHPVLYQIRRVKEQLKA